MEENEHVGVVRSVNGNNAHILGRFAAHNRTIAGLMPLGLALHHRGNPAAALHLHKLYAAPVLLSGMATLVLKKSEVVLIDQHIKNTVLKLQKLMDRTPACVVYFLGGVLPGTALIHCLV